MSNRTSNRQETRPLVSEKTWTDVSFFSIPFFVSLTPFQTQKSDDEEKAVEQHETEQEVENDHLLWKCIPIDCLPLYVQIFMQKQLTSNNGLVLLLILLVIGLGAVNRVMYKIQVTEHTMKPYV